MSVKPVLGEKRFAFPKSIYAVHDTINFFVANKPNALIIDFFAGSGTTLHAVNLLNAEDGGHRRCILVTNNEVSADEATTLSAQGYKPGDAEWERLGIAQYVTWPRTVCSIEGHDVNGNPLDGNYISSATKTTEKSRNFTKIDFAIEFGQMKTSDKKALLKFCANGALPQKLVTANTRFVISEEANHTASILYDDTALEEWLEALDGMTHITDFYIVTKSNKIFKQAKSEIQEALGNIEITEPLLVPMANGFKANAIFFKLGFLDKNAVALGKQFKELLPILWMKAGAIGKMPIIDSENIPNMLIMPENHFAVLTNEIFYEEFAEQVNAMPEIETAYIITDYEPGYRNMISGLTAKYTYQLYRDYLDNFRINTGRN